MWLFTVHRWTHFASCSKVTAMWQSDPPDSVLECELDWPLHFKIFSYLENKRKQTMTGMHLDIFSLSGSVLVFIQVYKESQIFPQKPSCVRMTHVHCKTGNCRTSTGLVNMVLRPVKNDCKMSTCGWCYKQAKLVCKFPFAFGSDILRIRFRLFSTMKVWLQNTRTPLGVCS